MGLDGTDELNGDPCGASEAVAFDVAVDEPSGVVDDAFDFGCFSVVDLTGGNSRARGEMNDFGCLINDLTGVLARVLERGVAVDDEDGNDVTPSRWDRSARKNFFRSATVTGSGLGLRMTMMRLRSGVLRPQANSQHSQSGKESCSVSIQPLFITRALCFP